MGSLTTSHATGLIDIGSSVVRILIVDDDPDITSLFTIGLEHSGFEVHAYNDPLEALAKFKPHFYDLLLSDITMPKSLEEGLRSTFNNSLSTLDNNSFFWTDSIPDLIARESYRKISPCYLCYSIIKTMCLVTDDSDQ